MDPSPQPEAAPNPPVGPAAADSTGNVAVRLFATRLTTAYCIRGHEHRMRGELDQALSDFNEALRLDPECADACNNRGNVFFARGDYDRAIADYGEAVRRNPGLAEAYINRALAYARLQRFGKAIEDAATALRLNPNLASAHFILGAAYSARRCYDQAVAEFTEALRLEPGNALTYNDRGMALTGKGWYAEAVADFDHAIRLAPQLAPAHQNRARASFLKGDHAQAVLGFTRALELDPGNAAAYYHRGMTHLARKDYESAVADFTAALRLAPGNVLARARREQAVRMADQSAQPPAAPVPAAPIPAPLKEGGQKIEETKPAGPGREVSFPGMSRTPEAKTGDRPAVVLPVAGFSGFDEAWPAEPRWASVVGTGALFLAAVALLSASAPAWCGFVLPLGVAGLLVGLVGLLVLRALGQSRMLLPAVGSVAGGVVVFAALLFPNLLGPYYRMSREKPPAEATGVRAVPLPGSNENPGPADADWPDASRAALQAGRLHVQVLDASVQAVKKDRSPGSDLLPGEYLFLRLRVRNTAAPAGPAVNPRQPPTPQDKPRPALTDLAGKLYPLQEVTELLPAEGRSSVFPVSVRDVVFVFAAPPPDLDFLHLEVPAGTWGAKASLRFRIPVSMIQRRRPS